MPRNIHITTDNEGFLSSACDWDQATALFIAQQLEITLTPAHWEIINFLRNYYFEHQTIPPFRIVISLIKAQLGLEKGKSIYLYRLFPGNPLKYACKIAGLPKPKHCM